MLVLDDSALAEARVLHPLREGFFTLARRADAPVRQETAGGAASRKAWRESSYHMSSMASVLESVRNTPDVYISQASFAVRARGNANVHAIACNFVDLDCYNLGLLPDESTMQAIFLQAQRSGIPLPSYMMSSGRGLYAKWVFDQPISGALLPHWQKLQAVLGHVFAAFGADPNARDLARVLRTASSINSKSGDQVRVSMQTGHRYRFAELAAQAATIDIPDVVRAASSATRRIRAYQGDLQEVPSDLGALIEYSQASEPILMRQFSRQSLNWTRFLDMRDLMIRRGGAARGSRDVMLFWMTAALASAGVINTQNFWIEVERLLRAFPVSRDFNPMQDGSLGTLKKRIESHCRGEKVEFKGVKYSPVYTPSNDFLINVLSITDEEMLMMKTLISAQEKRRRADEKVPGRGERRDDRIGQRILAVQMMDQGATQAEIASRLGVNKSTVCRWLKDDQVPKTRAHMRSQAWTHDRIEQWRQKREQLQQQRLREREQLEIQNQHIESARQAQVLLKTSVHLMRIEESLARRKQALDSPSGMRAMLRPLQPEPRDAGQDGPGT